MRSLNKISTNTSINAPRERAVAREGVQSLNFVSEVIFSFMV